MAGVISETPPAGLFERMRHAGTRIETEAQYRAAVVRDLQNLLGSTRRWPDEELASTPNVLGSVVNYGVPSITGRVMTIDSADQIAQEIRAAIVRFDNRFERSSLEVRGSLGEPGVSAEVIRLTVSGLLLGLPEPVPFFGVVHADIDNGTIEIVSEGHDQ